VGDQADAFQRFEESVEICERAFKKFRSQQTTHGGNVTHSDKEELRNRLSALDAELDRYLAGEYGIQVAKRKDFEKWKVSHQPFHWFVEFYGIMLSGGFDVVIGNPPYVELSDIVNQYSIRNSSVLSTGNLYAVCTERFLLLLGNNAKAGVIVPISAISTPRMLPLMHLLASQSMLHVSSFAVRPGKLFTGVDMNLTICLVSAAMQQSDKGTIFSTRYNRWAEEARSSLFSNIAYVATDLDEAGAAIPKIGTQLELQILEKIKVHPRLDLIPEPASPESVYYHSGGRYFRKCIREKLSNEYKHLAVREGTGDSVICLLSSSLYYWLWIALSDCYHVTKRDISIVPVPTSLPEDKSFVTNADRLLADLERNARLRIRLRADGTEQREVNYFVGKSKHILDEIDTILALHYGLDNEELDFILNVDGKYRIGGADGENE